MPPDRKFVSRLTSAGTFCVFIHILSAFVNDSPFQLKRWSVESHNNTLLFTVDHFLFALLARLFSCLFQLFCFRHFVRHLFHSLFSCLILFLFFLFLLLLFFYFSFFLLLVILCFSIGFSYFTFFLSYPLPTMYWKRTASLSVVLSNSAFTGKLREYGAVVLKTGAMEISRASIAGVVSFEKAVYSTLAKLDVGSTCV